MLMNAYELELHREWSRGDRSPHGHAWHTSFHASEFPADDRLSCGRLAVYKLLDPPAAEPRKPFLEAWFDLGKDLELQWVRRFNSYGVLLSADQTAGEQFQTGFVDETHWFTGSSDAIVLIPERRQAHCVEVKTTSHEKVLKMLSSNGTDVPRQHAKYLRQLGAYIGLAHEAPFAPRVTICKTSGVLARPMFGNQDDEWRCSLQRSGSDRPHPLLHDGECELEVVTIIPPDDGTLIYSSREEPLTVASFRAVYDPAFMAAGRERLAHWRDVFLEEGIPEHPHEGARAKWSVDPCQYCEMKAEICKPDYQNKVASLRDSNLIAYAQGIDPSWSYEERRKAVLERWDALREETTTV